MPWQLMLLLKPRLVFYPVFWGQSVVVLELRILIFFFCQDGTWAQEQEIPPGGNTTVATRISINTLYI